MSLIGGFLALLTLPPVECEKSGGAGDALMLFLGLRLLLLIPLLTLYAAAKAPFAPVYVFIGAPGLEMPAEFRPKAVEAPWSAALREAAAEEEDSGLAKVEAREGLRGAAIRAGGWIGWPRDHRQNELELSKQGRETVLVSSNRRDRAKRKPVLASSSVHGRLSRDLWPCPRLCLSKLGVGLVTFLTSAPLARLLPSWFA